jgi:hypothetical protein
MNVEKHLKSQRILAIAYIIIGAIALITLIILLVKGNIDGKLLGIITGLTFGLLPLGILLLVDVIRIKRNPAMQKQIELKNEERNIFLRNKSGNQTLNVMLCVIMGLWFLNMWVDISSLVLFPIILGVTGIAYITLIGINARKY